MSRQTFKPKNFKPASLDLLASCNDVVADYLAQGFTLTLRQVFYQMVVRNILPNTERAYQNLSRLLSDGRLAGLVDWDAIEDRIRVPKTANEWSSPAEIMSVVLKQYRLPRWEDQDYLVELWVEKDALAGVLQPIATERHITLMVNRGYSSQSAMKEAYERSEQGLRDSKDVVILYLGDLDPSGEDMVRDIDDRLNELYGTEATVIKLAITPSQVQQYGPPPNPAKLSDSRAAGFIEKHGMGSYEVDALPPEVLRQLINDAVDQYVDYDRLDGVIAREDHDKALLEEAVKDIMERRENGTDE